MKTMLLNPQYLITEVLADILKPAPPMDLPKWCQDNIIFGEKDPFPGPFDFDKFPFMRKPLEVLQDDHPTRVVTFLKSAQFGGTILAQAFIGASMDLAPSDFLYTHPTNDNAARWSRTKWKTFVSDTKVLKAKFPNRSSEGSDTVLFKELKDGKGSLIISGANSPASLSMITVKRQVQDDLAKWVNNEAGDPEKQADSRSSAYEYAKILKISTPLIMPGCKITESFEKGTQEHWHVPCLQCGHKQVLDWHNFVKSITPETVDNPYFTCVKNGCVIEEKDREQIVLKGEWVAKHPERANTHISFAFWSAIGPLMKWPRIARAWLEVEGHPAAEQTFMNDVVGMAYKAKSTAPPWESLAARAEDSDYTVGTIPNGALVTTISVDCQLNRLEWQLTGFGQNKQKYVIEYGVIPHPIMEDAGKKALNALLNRQWTNQFGQPLKADILGIDGNAWTEDVFEWVRKHSAAKVIMTRGQPGDNAPLFKKVNVERNRHGNIVKKKPWHHRFYNIGVNKLKMYLYLNLEKKDPIERGFIHFPKGLTDNYYQMLTSETRIKKTNNKGVEYYIWVEDTVIRNEAMDLMNIAESCAYKLGVFNMSEEQWDELGALREVEPVAIQGSFDDLLGPIPQPKPRLKQEAIENTETKTANNSGDYLNSGGGAWL